MDDFKVTVTMNAQELRIFRRALAVEADKGFLDRTYALRRICEMDALRWKAEERRQNSAGRPVPIRRVPRYCDQPGGDAA